MPPSKPIKNKHGVQRMKYKFSNSEVGYISEDGKPQVYKVCEICGKEQKKQLRL